GGRLGGPRRNRIREARRQPGDLLYDECNEQLGVHTGHVGVGLLPVTALRWLEQGARRLRSPRWLARHLRERQLDRQLVGADPRGGGPRSDAAVARYRWLRPP